MPRGAFDSPHHHPMSPRLPPSKLKFYQQGARCLECPFIEAKVVPPEPAKSGAPALVLVGEAPGRNEEKLGRPFVGLGGKLVDRLLQDETKLPRTSTHLTNAALCRGDNEDDFAQAAKCCAPRLLREIHQFEAPIAPLGKLATKSILGLGKILFIRGFVWTAPELETLTAQKRVLKAPLGVARQKAQLEFDILDLRSKMAGRTVLPSIHPAFVLRSETWHPVIQADFRRFGRIVRDPSTRLADVGTHEVTQRVARLARLAPTVSLDVETTHTGSALTAELLCVGLSDSRTTIVLWPWVPKMAAPLSKFLRSRDLVVGHNLIQFDRVVLERHLVK